MSNARTIDARGLSCPQPAMLALQAIKELGRGEIEVLVDSNTARENISRLGRSSGWDVAIEELSPGDWRIVLKR